MGGYALFAVATRNRFSELPKTGVTHVPPNMPPAFPPRTSHPKSYWVILGTQSYW